MTFKDACKDYANKTKNTKLLQLSKKDVSQITNKELLQLNEQELMILVVYGKLTPKQYNYIIDNNKIDIDSMVNNLSKAIKKEGYNG